MVLIRSALEMPPQVRDLVLFEHRREFPSATQHFLTFTAHGEIKISVQILVCGKECRGRLDQGLVVPPERGPGNR